MIALQYGILFNMRTLLYKILSNTGTLQFELLSTIITPYYGVLSNMNKLKCDMLSLSAFLISASTGYRLLAGLVDECRVLCVLGKQRAEQTVYLPLGLLQGELETRRGQEEAGRRLAGGSHLEPGTKLYLGLADLLLPGHHGGQLGHLGEEEQEGEEEEKEEEKE